MCNCTGQRNRFKNLKKEIESVRKSVPRHVRDFHFYQTKNDKENHSLDAPCMYACRCVFL